MNEINRYSVLATAILLVFFIGCVRSQSIEFQPPTNGAARPWTDRPFKNDPADFQFAIVSDRTGGCRPGIFRKAMLQVNLLQPDFVMCVGDLIEGYTENRDMLKQQYDEMDTILNSLEMRFFRVAGNHEISNDVMANVYGDRYGLLYYHFVYKNVLFLILCTEDPPSAGISDTQVSYMRNVLHNNNTARWTLVFMHRPLFVAQKGKLRKGWAKIENILKDRPHTVFAGHRHNYMKHEKHGRNYIHLATTGGYSNLKGIAAGEFDHIVWVSMTDRGPIITNLMLDGIHDENVRKAE
ncbi:metallophosphoesterase [Desulfobacterales bacterium HSG2]|nr:metallophosphoesterase [Desulfobacterales bacterium HSG2]